MSFFRKNLEELLEPDLMGLEKEDTPESIRLEFKRELNLGDKMQKAEAAKDVSAMANTAGGRILYGVDERQIPDGSTVAGSVCPLTDATLKPRLEDVLLSTIFPRPRFRTWEVGVANGFVLVVELYPAYSGDLYMVTGFKENRFYRRGEQRTILMTEPEIREAYARIAASRLALEASIEDMMRSECERVQHLEESAIVVPWYGHRQLVDPRQFGASLSDCLANEVLHQNDWRSMAHRITVTGDGYRGYAPTEGQLGECKLYVSIRRNGLVHFAGKLDIPNSTDGQFRYMYPHGCLQTMIAALLTARWILEKAAYWGPVRVEYRLRVGSPFHLLDIGEIAEHIRIMRPAPIDAGEHIHTVPEFDFAQFSGKLKVPLRELLDQMFQTAGRVRCPWFDASGNLTNSVRSRVSPHLLKYLEE